METKNPAGTRGRHGRELWNSREAGAGATVACSNETDFLLGECIFYLLIKW